MQTLLVEVKDNTGLRILQELEQAHIIRLIQKVTWCFLQRNRTANEI